MELRALRARIQPALVQDFDAVREEFVVETGSQDPRAFVRHLRDWALIPNDLADRLLDELSTEPRHGAPSGARAAPAPRAEPSNPPPASPAPQHPTTGEIRVRVQRAAQPARTPAEVVPTDLLNLDDIEEVASFRSARTAAPAPEHDVGLFDASADGPAGSDESPDDPPTEPDGARAPAPAWARTSPSAPAPLEDEDTGATEEGHTGAWDTTLHGGPDEDATTVMRWSDDSGEIDPDDATRHMERSSLAAQLPDDEDPPSEPPPGDETVIRDLIDIADLHEAPTSVHRRSAGDDETVIRPGTPLVSFPPDPPWEPEEIHTAGPLTPMPDPGLVDQDEDDEIDPEAETVHVHHRTQITAATPPPATRRSVPPRSAGGPKSVPPADAGPMGIGASPLANADTEPPAAPQPGPVDLPAEALRDVQRTSAPAASPAPAAPRTEEAVARRYRVAELIADDGVARTYEAHDTALDRTVAVRVLNAEAAENPVVVQRFAAEIRVAMQLHHPAVPAVHEVIGATSYVHAPVEGPSLAMVLSEAREALGSRRPLPPYAAREALLQQLVQVCEAVAYAHERGVLHRDLRPDNIVLGPHGGVRVLEWGIARPITGVDTPLKLDPIDEDPRTLVGTPGYCSPEQANGNHRALDARSDVYALGLVLYEVLTLRPAVSGINPAAKLTRQQQGQLDPLAHAFGAPIPAPLREVVQRALQVHPDDRYANAGVMAEALRRAMRGESTGVLATAGRAMGRHPVLLVFAALALGTGWVVAALAALLPLLT